MPRLPKSNCEYWLPKLIRNKARDAEKLTALEALGWQVIVIWECETSDTQQLARRLEAFIRDAQLPKGGVAPLGLGNTADSDEAARV